MGLKFLNKSECPPGQFRYKCPETGQWITAIDWPDFVEKCKAHRRANNLPIGLLFEHQLEEQACMNTDPSACLQEGFGSVRAGTPSTFQQVISATRILLEWFSNFGEVEPKEVVEANSKICVGCNFNTPIVGCATCTLDKLREMVSSIVAKRPTEYDGRLDACRICGCSLKAKVRIPKDIIKKHDPAFKADAYPEWCWMRT